MRFLIDECLHTSLVAAAAERGYEAHHVNWLGLGGYSDRRLMRRIVSGDFTFVTNNARDFRRLCTRQRLHAGLMIIVPQVAPSVQHIPLDALVQGQAPVNEVMEISVEGEEIALDRYDLSDMAD